MTTTPPTPAAGTLDVPAPAWFISDLHLTPDMPRTLAAFERVLEQAAAQAKALFILGDFFEFWVGDEEADAPFARDVAAALVSLAARGVRVYLMHGNRDFLLGKRFARKAGATLLPDPVVIRCAGRRIVLTHGDMLCTDDERYMAFRRWTRKWWIQRLFLALPLRLRLRVARKLRHDSEAGRTQSEHTPVHLADHAPPDAHAPHDYGDVAPSAVRAMLLETGAQGMIHGHTHRPALHDTAEGFRWVLTDWDLDGRHPRASVLAVDGGGIRVLPQADAPDA